MREWSDIEAHYTSLMHSNWQVAPMLELVRYVISTHLSERLYAFTSLDKLVVGIYNPMEWDLEALHIQFDSVRQKLVFMYFPKPFEPVEFEREYDPEKGIEEFQNYIRMLKW